MNEFKKIIAQIDSNQYPNFENLVEDINKKSQKYKKLKNFVQSFSSPNGSIVKEKKEFDKYKKTLETIFKGYIHVNSVDKVIFIPEDATVKINPVYITAFKKQVENMKNALCTSIKNLNLPEKIREALCNMLDKELKTLEELEQDNKKMSRAWFLRLATDSELMEIFNFSRQAVHQRKEKSLFNIVDVENDSLQHSDDIIYLACINSSEYFIKLTTNSIAFPTTFDICLMARYKGMPEDTDGILMFKSGKQFFYYHYKKSKEILSEKNPNTSIVIFELKKQIQPNFLIFKRSEFGVQ